MAPKVASVIAGVWVAAQAEAPPMKGAVQGVDNTAVITPNPNDPGTVSWSGSMR